MRQTRQRYQILDVRLLVVIGGVLAALALARGLVAVAYANRIYPGVQAIGVDLGGQTVDQATNTLRTKLDDFGSKPVQITAGDRQLQLSPAELGFKPDAQVVAQKAQRLGRQGSLLTQLVWPVIGHAAADTSIDAIIVDSAAVDSAVNHIATLVDRPAVDATLAFSPQVTLTPSTSGQTLDKAQAREAIDEYLRTLRTGPLTLGVTTQEPRVSTAQLEPIRARAADILGRNVSLTDGQNQWPVSPSMVRAALALRQSPLDLSLDSAAFADAVAAAAGQVDQRAHDASLDLSSGEARINADQPGRTVDRAATATALCEALLAGKSNVALVVKTMAPAVKASDLQPTADLAQSILKKGLSLTVEGQSFPVAAAQLGPMIVVNQPSAGKWDLSLDQPKVEKLVAQINDQYEHPTIDARIGWENGQVKALKPTVPASVIDQPKAVASVLSGWQRGSVALPITTGEMALDQALIARLNGDLKGVVQERSISFAGSIPERANNVSLALQKINGTLVMPGEIFSFNRAVGPTTLEAGFRWGFGFTTDAKGAQQVVPSVAGGICQVATAVFQPVFWAGYQIEERHWHVFPMKNYAVNGYMGLDATVSPEDGLDLKFLNNTDHAILILAGTQGQVARVQIIGTKPNWTVKVDPEVISNPTPAPKDPVKSTSPLFAKGRQIILEEAQGGFTSKVVRHVITPDGKDRTLNLTSVYQPSPLSILVGTGG